MKSEKRKVKNDVGILGFQGQINRFFGFILRGPIFLKRDLKISRYFHFIIDNQ
jgi:hypothetical protein